MSVYSIWESRFPAGSAEDGIQATKAIWRDMVSFDGYVGHELIQDLDEPGHLFVVVEWESRAAADGAMSYASHPHAQRVDRLVSQPRRRTVGAPI
jgi:heme-degrading monooxygenase HmoA